MQSKLNKYTPDLRSFMAVCTANYAKLLKLLPQVESFEGEKQIAEVVIAKQPNLQILLLQKSRYTQTLKFVQLDKVQHLNRNFCVRVYHDAQLVEVLSGVHDPMLPPVYKVPNSSMKQVDEKAQLNRFLGEWLSFCLEYGKVDIQYTTQLAFLS